MEWLLNHPEGEDEKEEEENEEMPAEPEVPKGQIISEWIFLPTKKVDRFLS